MDAHGKTAAGALGNTASAGVVVVGAGFSGTIAAIQLRRRLPAGLDVYLVERSGEFARGVAFADSEVPHLLNVRAANMGAFADDTGHFERWLNVHAPHWPEEVLRTEAGNFATRRIFGKYLQATLHGEIAASGGNVHLLTGEVLALEQTETGCILRLDGGRTLEARGAVLATGSLPANRPCDGVEFHDPWTPEAVAGLRPEAPVLIVGTGLTMIDLVHALDAQGFYGPILALSRRGLLPLPHEHIAQGWPVPELGEAVKGSALALFQAIRAQIRAAAARNIGWRAVIDSLRPITAALWRGLPLEERVRFLRHIRPFWDVHRHRMAPPAAELINRLRAEGRLRVMRGRVREVLRDAGGATVVYDECPSGERKGLKVQRVIYATGFQGARASGGLVAALLDSGQARLDAQGLGVEVTPALNLVDAAGKAALNLWALGPIVRGTFWECLAVPDIRMQADHLAREIAATLDAPGGYASEPLIGTFVI
jgi:uncharacterized NAD(P)/FAD-binding protein YdhS